MKKPTLSHTHCQVTQSQPHKSKLVNKYVFCQRTVKMKIVANLKEKYTEMKERQPLTKCINHWVISD